MLDCIEAKKSQISIFILLGFILFIAISLLILINDKPHFSTETEFDLFSLQTYLDTCLAQVTNDQVQMIGFQGGYYTVLHPVDSAITIPYYFQRNATDIPSTQTIETSIEAAVTNALPHCVNEFHVFKEQGYTITIDSISVAATAADSLYIELTFPIIVSKGGVTRELEKVQYNHPINVNKIKLLLQDFREEHQKHPDYIPIGYLSQAAQKDNFTFDISYLPNNVVVYSIFFPTMLKNDDSLRWAFAAQYRWEELEE